MYIVSNVEVILDNVLKVSGAGLSLKQANDITRFSLSFSIAHKKEIINSLSIHYHSQQLRHKWPKKILSLVLDTNRVQVPIMYMKLKRSNF